MGNIEIVNALNKIVVILNSIHVSIAVIFVYYVVYNMFFKK